MMTLDLPQIIGSTALAIFSAIAGAYINERFRRPRLITYYGHTAAFTARPDQNNPTVMVTIHTHTVFIRNAGRQSAKNVRLGHAILPNFQIAPTIEYRVIDLDGTAKEILIPTLPPKDLLVVSYLYFPPLTYAGVNTYVKSDEAIAKHVPVILTQQLTRARIYSLFALLILGGLTALYFVFVLLRALYPFFSAWLVTL